ncbi:spore coat protein CotJB [Roseburia hominis]
MSDMNLETKPNRKDLLCLIGQASFAVDDVKLYLDTHPCDTDALDYFYEHSKIRNQALREYAKYYGPLTVDTAVASCTDRWNWINEPWPWQEGWC